MFELIVFLIVIYIIYKVFVVIFGSSSNDNSKNERIYNFIAIDPEDDDELKEAEKNLLELKKYYNKLTPNAPLKPFIKQQESFIKEFKRSKYKIKNPLKTSSLKNYVIFDLETTGLDETRNEIIEIGAIKVKDEKEYVFHSLIRPQKNITTRITKINGITNEMVMDEPSLEVILPDFLDFIEKLPLVAHNASFDMKFLMKAIDDMGLDELECSTVDTLVLARKILPKLHNHKLETLVNHFNIETNGSHRALDDAKATQKVLQKLIDKDTLKF